MSYEVKSVETRHGSVCTWTGLCARLCQYELTKCVYSKVLPAVGMYVGQISDSPGGVCGHDCIFDAALRGLIELDR